jgi:hypothetical protein
METADMDDPIGEDHQMTGTMTLHQTLQPEDRLQDEQTQNQ